MKVTSTISQKGVASTISQKGVKSSMSQKGVASSIAEGGVTHYPPVYVSSEVGLSFSNHLVLTFDKALDVGLVPANGDFVVTFSGGALTWGVWIYDLSPLPTYYVTLVLSRVIAPGETGTVAYTPGVQPITGTNGDYITESFSGTVTNNVTGTVPVFVSAAVANATPTKVVLTYDQTLDTGSVPATTDFTLAGKTISNVAVVGATVEVTVTVAYAYGDVIAISYTKGANPIQGDVGELDAADLVNQAVTNNISADADLTTYITGLVTPLSAGQLVLLNNFIKTLKTGLSITNLSDAFDCVYVLAGETAESSLRNLVKRLHDATAVNTPTFTALEGFLGDGATNYINTNYNPKTEGSNLVLNSASFGIYSRTDRDASTSKMHGVSGITESIHIIPLRAAGSPRVYCNDNTLSNISATGTLGMTTTMRSNVTTKHGARNKTITNFAVNSVAIPDGNIYLLARNIIGTGVNNYDNIQLSFAFTGRNLIQAELNTLFDAFEAYMDANGKGVI